MRRGAFVTRTRTRTAGLLAGLAVLAAGIAVCGGSGDGAAPAFETAPAERGRLEARVTATGTLSPLVEVQVGSQVSGRIQELLVDFNDPVTRGQVIARIDPRLFETEVARARANLTAAEAAVARAAADLTDARLRNERAAGLYARGMGARADADTALAAFEAARAAQRSAEAAREQARAALAQAETNLGYTTIVSPIDGVVISRDVDLGQTVAASFQTPTLFTIAEDLRKMEVHTHVAEADVGRLRAGMPVAFGVDAWPGERFAGVVKEVRYAPETVQNVVTYDAVVSVDNGDLKLRPGMTAEVVFLVEARDDALQVPNAALRFVPPDDLLAAAEPPPEDGAGAASRVLWVLDGGEPRPVRVRVGISDGRSTEVTDGPLAPGDRVITGLAGEPGDPDRPRFGRFL
jgi:HlyD family secretion protein